MKRGEGEKTDEKQPKKIIMEGKFKASIEERGRMADQAADATAIWQAGVERREEVSRKREEIQAKLQQKLQEIQ